MRAIATVAALLVAGCAPAALTVGHDDPLRRPWRVALTPDEVIDGVAQAIDDPAPLDGPRYDARRAGSRDDGGVQRLEAAAEVAVQRAGAWSVVRSDPGAGTITLRRSGFPAPVVVLLRAYPAGEGHSLVRAWGRNRFAGSAGRRLAELMALAERHWQRRGVAAAPVDRDLPGAVPAAPGAPVAESWEMPAWP